MNEALIGGLFAAALLLMWAVITYNRFVRLSRHIQESWADIDVELKRRYELIPNLVATVKGHAEYERDTIEQVIALRAKAMDNRGSAVSQALDESALMIGLKRMFAVVEGYPELKASTHYMALQRELANTEDRIAAARRFYNGNVRDMNVLLESFPAGVIGRKFNFEAATFFELASEAERVVPRIEL
jgi:LemA protein